jgi:hypothetical protein
MGGDVWWRLYQSCSSSNLVEIAIDEKQRIAALSSAQYHFLHLLHHLP